MVGYDEVSDDQLIELLSKQPRQLQPRRPFALRADKQKEPLADGAGRTQHSRMAKAATDGKPARFNQGRRPDSALNGMLADQGDCSSEGRSSHRACRARAVVEEQSYVVTPSNVSFCTQLGAVINDDCLAVLRDMPTESVDLVITSPPYDGQSKYGNGERYERDWYREQFLAVTEQIFRILTPSGNFVLNYRSKRRDDERGTLQYELIFWLRDQGFLFCEDFVWGKPSPPPGRFNRFLKDAVEYCFQFAKTRSWQFYPEQCLSPARWDAKDRERRKRLAHNYERVNAPSGQGRKRVQAGPDMVRPSTLLHLEPDFTPNPSKHPTRFPLALPKFFINLLTTPGQLVVDPFAGTGTAGLAAEQLGRRWLAIEVDPKYATVIPSRFKAFR